ncbi:SRPBCC domain-containing protein [Streptomyces sp. B6B3]|jgi:uncharacterized protein YndB with AHSA1/START domain|uniref:SRPBCC family protein n=1 Tax=Streptomyces sp. B6B3 TaxID=3153570 RepID=UPI00325CCD84
MSQHSYTLTRELNASAADIFTAWTDPAQYEAWSGAAPGSVEQDVTPGGKWQAVMVTPDGQSFPLSGSYPEVEQDRRLVIAMDVPHKPDPELMTMTLDEGTAPGTTRITITQACDTEAERDMSEQGTGMLLDWLTTFLDKR